jgi:hypothetical protein
LMGAGSHAEICTMPAHYGREAGEHETVILLICLMPVSSLPE